MTVAAPVSAVTPGGPGDHAAEARRAARGRRILPYWLLAPGMLWLLVFFLVPIATLASMSLQTGDFYNGYALTWHFSQYADAMKTFYPQFLRSLLYAGAATIAALVIAYPLAYAIAFKAGRWKYFLLVGVVAPFFTSYLVRTLAWETILQDDGPVVSTLHALHLVQGKVLATPFAVICGLTYNFLPFMTLPLYASLEKIDGRLVEAANDLYANSFTAFRRVTWPLSMPGVVAGTLLTFIPAAGDYVNQEFLGNVQSTMIGNVIQRQFLTNLNYPLASSLSVVLMITIVAMVWIYVRRAGTEELV